MASSWRRASWLLALIVGLVGLAVSVAGILNAFPVVDFGTDVEHAHQVRGQHQLQLGWLLLLLAAVAFLTARCRGSAAAAAAAAAAAISAALLASGAGSSHNVTLPGLAFLVLGVAAAILAVKERPRSHR